MALDKLTFHLIQCREFIELPSLLLNQALVSSYKIAYGKQAQLLEPTAAQASYILHGL